jgi:hypothetical protein
MYTSNEPSAVISQRYPRADRVPLDQVVHEEVLSVRRYRPDPAVRGERLVLSKWITYSFSRSSGFPSPSNGGARINAVLRRDGAEAQVGNERSGVVVRPVPSEAEGEYPAVHSL